MQLQDLFQEFTTTTAIFSGITFACGTWIGHRLSVGRDRRKEFNDLTGPAYVALRKQLNGMPGTGDELVHVPIEMLEFYFWPWQRRALRLAAARYSDAVHACKRQRDDWTNKLEATKDALGDVEVAVRDLSRWLKPR